ncbi:MAG: sugar phosphate isomerase/epimerase [Alphaproteobacteria bacterium]|nr:sugar phosphate isomerase/epimerase [Alphaproteobacteria bacterium]
MKPPDPERLCIHQVTLLERCDFCRSVDCLARNGVFKTAIWRDMLDAVGLKVAKRALADSGVAAPVFCSAGFLTAADPKTFNKALDDNRRRIEQAAELGAKVVVTLTGGLDPTAPDLDAARARAFDGLAQLLPAARATGVRLALEPLHPMVCGLRSVLSTLGDANDWLDQLDADDTLGLTVDSYALWWDPALKREIARAGKRIQSFHVSDWRPETRDVRLDRGMPGDGLIDNRKIRSWLEMTGFDGLIEVEIFSALDWWRRDPDEVVRTIKARYASFL